MTILQDRIRERMKALDLSQLATAKKAGLGAHYVRDIIRGRLQEPGSHKLAQLARALECSTEYLLGVADTPGDPASIESLGRSVISLPVIHVLAEGVFRRREDPRHSMEGVLAIVTEASVPRPGMQWVAYVDDKHAEPLIPQGYFVEIIDIDADAQLPVAGDLVVIENIIAERDLVERHIVRVMGPDASGFNYTVALPSIEEQVWQHDGLWVASLPRSITDPLDRRIIGRVANAFRSFYGAHGWTIDNRS